MTVDELKQYISAKYSDKLAPLDSGRRAPLYEVKPEMLVETARALRDDENLKFEYLCNLGGIDTKERFEVIYSIASITNRLRLDFKIILPYDKAEVDSIQQVWPAANWYEREMWELYGINVKNHDNLKCFLLPENWNQGYPMRKNWDAPDFVRFPEFEV